MERAIGVTFYNLLFFLSLFLISCLELIEKEEGQACLESTECFADLVCEDSVCRDPLEEPFYREIAEIRATSAYLVPNESLKLRQYIQSSNKKFRLKLLSRGKLILKDRENKKIIWKSNTGKKGVKNFLFEDNGNLVLVKDSGEIVWESSTKNSNATKLIVEDNGELVLYKNNKKVWSATDGDTENDDTDNDNNNNNGENNKKVKVFIMAGQSNMQGKGRIKYTSKEINKNGGEGTLQYLVENDSSKNPVYKHLINSNGEWSSRDDAWIADVEKTGPVTVKNRKDFGPDMQFSHVMGNYYKSQVLIIKTAWGGKSLAVDFRPPSSGGEIGPYYKTMVDRINEVLKNIGKHVPNYNNEGYEITGFGWHQGWNDRVNKDFVSQYQTNLVNFINDIRSELKYSKMPFVIATTGMPGFEETSDKATSLMEAQVAVPNDPGLKEKNVITIDTRDFYRNSKVSPGSQTCHWNQNAESYFLIGDSMGKSMIKLISKGSN